LALSLSIAVGDYDRMRPLMDGAVQIDGVNPVFMRLYPEEIFFRALRHQDFDVCELSLSSFTVKTDSRENPYVGIPVFPSRAFRHTSVFIRSDRGIKAPADLRGRRIGVPEYQLTAIVWARAFLQDDYGVSPADVTWVRGGLEAAGRVEKITLNLPPEVKLEDAPAGKTLSGMLEAGEIDAIIAPRAPSGFDKHPHISWLFDDPVAVASDYFRRTRIFPIMHVLGLRRTIAEAHPWLPGALFKAFDQSKTKALAHLTDVSATKVTMPFVEEHLRSARQLMGWDFWPYGIEPNRHVLESFLRHHHAQGLSSRVLDVDELFHPGTRETYTI
jgi:4,5-dihydroxyphthalate decarboxylase